MAQLKLENEQLRRVFADACREFEKRDARISELEKELKTERELTSKLKLAYDKINSELIAERGKSKKLASMLFGLKSEKIKLADIDVKDTVVCERKEEVDVPLQKLLTEKEKRPRGAPVGHR